MVATAAKLKSCRIKSGLSVKQVQSVFNFSSPNAIYNWESGKDIPSIDNLVVVSAIYGVELDELIVTRTVEIECELMETKSA